MKDDHRKQLETISSRRMNLRAALDTAKAEDMLPEFLPDECAGQVARPGSSAQSESVEVPQSAEQTSSSSFVATIAALAMGTANDKVQQRIKEKADRMQKQLEDRAVSMATKAAQVEEAQTKKRQERQDEIDRKKKEVDDYKLSAEGKADEYLKGLQKDIMKCNKAIDESATCGMPVGFAREWRTSLNKALGELQKFEKSFTTIKEGNSGLEYPAQEFEKAKNYVTSFRQQLANFNTAKKFGANVAAKTAS